MQQDNAAGLSVAKQRNGGIHPLLQVAETDDVAEGLDGVQNAVGAAKSLDEPVHLQVLVHPEGVQGGGVKAGEEHIHHDQQIQFLVFHPQGDILVVILEFVTVGGVVGVEHLVVVPDGGIQKVPAALIQGAGVLTVLLVQDAVRFLLVGSVAIDRCYPQLLCGVGGHLLFELLVIELGHGHRGHGENGVEATDPLLLLNFLHCTVFPGGHFRNVGKSAEQIGLVPPVGLLVKVLQNILGDQLDPFGSHVGLFPVDVPDTLVVNVRLGVHGLDVVHPEGQHILVVDGVHNGVGVKPFTEGLVGGEELCPAGSSGIGRKDGGTGEPEQVVLLEIFDNGRVHITELAAVTLVEDNDHPFPIDRMVLLLLDKGGQLLDSSDDDVGVIILQLLFQNSGGGVAVCRSLLKSVILFHGLVVQILPVHHKQHLVDVGQLGGQTSRLEGGQRLAAAGGVPDVAAALNGAILLVVVGDLNAVQYPLRGGDLIGPHDHQHIFRGEDAIPGQHIQNGVFGEEGAGEVDEVGDHLVIGVCPEGCKLEAVAGLLLFRLAGGRLPDCVEAGGVGVVLGVGAVGDDEDLHILKKAAPRPERVPLVTVDLVKRLSNGNTPTL